MRQNARRMMQAIRVRRARDGQRGSALVEFALVVVLMMTLIFGIVEFSLAWSVKSQAQAAVRAGGRTASALTKSDDLTVNAALAVGAALQSVNENEPEYVMIYRVGPGDSGDPPSGGSCAAASCSKFDWDPVAKQFKTSTDNGPGWTATNQLNNCDVSDPSQFDQVGVYVKVTHPFIAIQNFVPGMSNDVVLDPHSVFRLEPSSSTGCS